MGLDSLDLAELVIQLEDSMDITVDLTPQLNTPAKLAAYISFVRTSLVRNAVNSAKVTLFSAARVPHSA